MGFDQYHDLPEELPENTRTYVRVIQSLKERDRKSPDFRLLQTNDWSR